MQYTLTNVSKRLTADVIEECFKIKINNEDKVESIIVTRAAAAGEGLISCVYRIQVKGLHYQTSFVAKGLVGDPLLRKSLRCAKFFNRQIMFFSNILPLFIEVQKGSGAKENIQDNVPVCYAFYAGDDDDYILMDDLSASGYIPISKIPTPLEKELTLKTLSHLHAVSFALKIKKPDVFKKIVHSLPEVYYNEDNRLWYGKFLRNAIDINKNVIMEYEHPSSNYYKKFMDLADKDIYEQLIELSSNKTEITPVLNHGDAWLPNFMCSKEKTMAIDFQLFRCSSLVTDITFFLTLCSDMHSTKDDYIKSLEVYYSYLTYFLTDMGLDAREIYSWEDFTNEMKRYGRFGLLASLSSIPLLVSDRCDVQNSFFDKFVGVERIPLEELWILTPIKKHNQKMVLVNAVRVAVDLGLI